LGGDNPKFLSALANYLVLEHQDKKSSPYDLNGWKLESAKGIPRQTNTSDCGVFTCRFAEYVTRRDPINFTQDHMEYFRKRMVYEILSLKLW
jgi:sentrin-specific protease 1